MTVKRLKILIENEIKRLEDYTKTKSYLLFSIKDRSKILDEIEDLTTTLDVINKIKFNYTLESKINNKKRK